MYKKKHYKFIIWFYWIEYDIRSFVWVDSWFLEIVSPQLNIDYPIYKRIYPITKIKIINFESHFNKKNTTNLYTSKTIIIVVSLSDISIYLEKHKKVSFEILKFFMTRSMIRTKQPNSLMLNTTNQLHWC